METLLKDEQGQTNPIMIILVVMSAIITMSLLLIFSGSFMDVFLVIVSDYRAANPLSAWGNSMMDALPLKYAPYVFYVPGFFILILLVWGVKTVIKRHEYTKADQQYISGEDDY